MVGDTEDSVGVDVVGDFHGCPPYLLWKEFGFIKFFFVPARAGELWPSDKAPLPYEGVEGSAGAIIFYVSFNFFIQL